MATGYRVSPKRSVAVVFTEVNVVVPWPEASAISTEQNVLEKTAFGKVQRGTGGCFDPLFLCVVSHYFSICFLCFNLLLNTFNHFVSHLHICPHSAGLSPPVSSFSSLFLSRKWPSVPAAV